MLRSRSLSAVVVTVLGLTAPAMADTPEPLVTIEVRFVTVNDDFLERLGIDFDFDVTALPVTPEGSPPFVIGVPTGPVVPDPVGLLSREQNAQILISPRIVTPSGEAAKFFIGREIPYVDLFPGQTPPADAPIDVPFGISLDIVPNIGPDGRIILDVGPRMTDFGETGPGPAPGLIDRSVKTTVTVPDGGTVVIGGLLTDETRQAGAKVPVLRDLPVLGPLFRDPAGQIERHNLIILVTPRIVGDEEEGGGGIATVDGPAEPQDVATVGTADAAPPPTPEQDTFTEIFRSIFGYVPCTHPIKPCEVSRRADESGNYPRESERRRDHHPDGDADQEQK